MAIVAPPLAASATRTLALLFPDLPGQLILSIRQWSPVVKSISTSRHYTALTVRQNAV